jgi:PAS domain S-box-containing protein
MLITLSTLYALSCAKINYNVVPNYPTRQGYNMNIEELITHNKKLESELSEYKQRYKLLTEASSDGLWDWEITTGKLYNSPRWKETLGFENNEIGSSLEMWKSRVHPDDIDGVMEAVDKHLSGITPIYKAEYRLRHKDNHYIWILDHGKAHYDENGVPIRMGGSMTDISDRKEKENLLRTVLNCMSEGILVMNPKGEFIYTNPSFSTVLGLTIDQIEGKTPMDPSWRVIHEDGSPYPGDTHPSWRTLQTGVAIHNDIQGVYTSDDKINWISANSEPIFNTETNELSGVVITFTDITEQRKLLQQLQVFNKELEDEVKMQVNVIRQKDQMMLHQSRLATMGEMISMIAHQWRQPITVIGMMANNLILDAKFNDLDLTKIEEDLNMINTQVDYLSRTIDDFSNFFKADTNPQTIYLKNILEEAADLLKPALEKEKIKLILRIDTLLEVTLYKNEMQQVIINIINNARDVLKERQVISPQIDIEACIEENQIIHFIISDNAGGIDSKIIDKIFDPYFSTKNGKNGTGLGLYMAKTIMRDRMQGDITVNNTDIGASFHIFIPII